MSIWIGLAIGVPIGFGVAALLTMLIVSALKSAAEQSLPPQDEIGERYAARWRRH
jgi:hypothetical protein